jgi:hypothetical protein
VTSPVNKRRRLRERDLPRGGGASSTREASDRRISRTTIATRFTRRLGHLVVVVAALGVGALSVVSCGDDETALTGPPGLPASGETVSGERYEFDVNAADKRDAAWCVSLLVRSKAGGSSRHESCHAPLTDDSVTVEYSLDCVTRDLLLFGAAARGIAAVRLVGRQGEAALPVEQFAAPGGVRIEGTPFVASTRAEDGGYLEFLDGNGSTHRRLRLPSRARICRESKIRDPVVVGRL